MSEKTPWQWYAANDGGEYYRVDAATREDVIAAARYEWPGEPFCILEARKARFPFPSAGDIMNWVFEEAAEGEYFIEQDCEPLGKPEEWVQAEAELDAALAAWFAKWERLFPQPDRFAETRNAEEIAGDDDQERAAE